MNKKELNEAMYKVLITKYKKDAKKEHKIVETAGYEIYKSGGDWVIKNKETWKLISLGNEEPYYRTIRKGHYEIIDTPVRKFYHGDVSKYININDICKIDFVNCIDTPTNKDKYDDRYSIYNSRKRALSAAKWDVYYHNKEIKNIRAQIVELQNDLTYQLRRAEESEKHLNEIRKEFGLKAR